MLRPGTLKRREICALLGNKISNGQPRSTKPTWICVLRHKIIWQISKYISYSTLLKDSCCRPSAANLENFILLQGWNSTCSVLRHRNWTKSSHLVFQKETGSIAKQRTKCCRWCIPNYSITPYLLPRAVIWIHRLSIRITRAVGTLTAGSSVTCVHRSSSNIGWILCDFLYRDIRRIVVMVLSDCSKTGWKRAKSISHRRWSRSSTIVPQRPLWSTRVRSHGLQVHSESPLRRSCKVENQLILFLSSTLIESVDSYREKYSTSEDWI